MHTQLGWRDIRAVRAAVEILTVVVQAFTDAGGGTCH